MAGDIGWRTDPGAFTAYLTTDLNSLANNAICTDGAEINNESTGFHTFMDIRVDLNTIDVSAQSNPAIDIYMVESDDDGTTFESAGTSDGDTADDDMPPADKRIAIIGVRVSDSEAKMMIKSMIPIPPGRFKLYPRNKCGVAWNATGNAIAYRIYQLGYT